MTSGDLFRPADLRDASGRWTVFPPAVVDRQRTIRDGPKRLYRALWDRAGANDHCFPSFERLAEDLGKPERQVRADLPRLIEAGLIVRSHREGRRANTYRFLWHAMFERQDTTGQTDDDAQFERQDTTGQPTKPEPRAAGNGEFERSKTVDLSGRILPANYSRELLKGTAAAATEVSDHPADTGDWPAAAAAVRLRFPTTDDAMVSRIIAAGHAAKADLGDQELADAIDRATLEALRTQRSAALFLRTVPEVLKSAGVKQESEAKSRAEWQQRVEREREHQTGQTVEEPEAGEAHHQADRARRCRTCRGEGTVTQHGTLLIAWCSEDCEAARRKRETVPEYVEQYNLDMARIAASFEAPKPRRNGKPAKLIECEADLLEQLEREMPARDTNEAA